MIMFIFGCVFTYLILRPNEDKISDKKKFFVFCSSFKNGFEREFNRKG